MELMEDGNLMDKVLILIQRDMEYYNEKQSVLQEQICPGIVGGTLDFPRSASYAAMKMVLWWEDEFVAAYKKPSGFLQEQQTSMMINKDTGTGMVKNSDPSKFHTAIVKSSDLLLEHLHVLTQEALDHADLTVLTGTIGATALIKNCLWCYAQRGSEQLQRCQKKYQQMGEALAERLLDLHCRLLSLYILQDAESLDWEDEKLFCEAERGSYVIQMWWLYMQGTRDDLWNTVPPKMAQRIFAGMLNETLNILAVRYSHAIPSPARSQLYTVDIANILLCVTKLLPAVCSTADEFTGCALSSRNKMLRDIHSKCHELLTCLLLRGSDLHVLVKMLNRGFDHGVFLQQVNKAEPTPWMAFAMNHLYPDLAGSINCGSVVIELLVLLPQPQPNWAHLVKVLCMEGCKLGQIILHTALKQVACCKSVKALTNHQGRKKCVFLCPGDGSCKGVDVTSLFLNIEHYKDIVQAFTFMVLVLGNLKEYKTILVKFITQDAKWFECFDRRQVWSQQRPHWYESIVKLVAPLLHPVCDIVINAVKTGASMYQATSIVLTACTQLWDASVGPELWVICELLQDLLPSSVAPMGGALLIQMVVSAVYSDLLRIGTVSRVGFEADNDLKKSGEDVTKDSNASWEIALSIAEALCGIDEDNKHTEEINALIVEARRSAERQPMSDKGLSRATGDSNALEVVTSLLLCSQEGKKSLKVLHHFIMNNDEWLMDTLQSKPTQLQPNLANKKGKSLLHTMFYIGDRPFDELLTGSWAPNWQQMFMVPMDLSPERVSTQIFARWDLQMGRNHDAFVSLQKIFNYHK